MSQKKVFLIIFSIIVGLCFTAFLLYDQRGIIGQTEIIALTFTTIITIIILVIMIKKNK